MITSATESIRLCVLNLLHAQVKSGISARLIIFSTVTMHDRLSWLLHWRLWYVVWKLGGTSFCMFLCINVKNLHCDITSRELKNSIYSTRDLAELFHREISGFNRCLCHNNVTVILYLLVFSDFKFRELYWCVVKFSCLKHIIKYIWKYI